MLFPTTMAWMVTDSTTKEKFLLDKDGKVMFRSGTEVETTFNVNNFDMHHKDGENDPYHLVLKDATFTLKGTAVAPWLVRVTNDDDTCDLVETISGQTLFSHMQSVSVAIVDDTMLYVYTQNADGVREIYRVS